MIISDFRRLYRFQERGFRITYDLMHREWSWHIRVIPVELWYESDKKLFERCGVVVRMDGRDIRKGCCCVGYDDWEVQYWRVFTPGGVEIKWKTNNNFFLDSKRWDRSIYRRKSNKLWAIDRLYSSYYENGLYHISGATLATRYPSEESQRDLQEQVRLYPYNGLSTGYGTGVLVGYIEDV